EHQAEEVRLALLRMQKEYLVDLEDAVVVVKNAEGKLRLHQSVELTSAGAAGGGFWGLLIGLLFGVPLVGMLSGAAFGALAGRLSDYGIDDNFIKNLSETLKPSTSALFVLVRKATPDKVLEELSKFNGRVLKTSLTAEAEAQIAAALETKV
ncbi:MAG TPA: DUF1269 domain-containing protein, partial [Planctomycetaceae bacterium]|nr:DUF1269 domain-containing protein [Planctomycetaceae bacterium]HIQ22249.1 DUF1269 domain-containing protein [Planctomycetota bacterium]